MVFNRFLTMDAIIILFKKWSFLKSIFDMRCFCFNHKKMVTEGYRILIEIFVDVPSIKTCEYWFCRFKCDD